MCFKRVSLTDMNTDLVFSKLCVLPSLQPLMLLSTSQKMQTFADNDVLPPTETGTEPTQIALTNSYGKMNKRRRQAVIRFKRFNKDYDSNNWFRAKLKLYCPSYNETSDLPGGYATYEQHYNHVKHIVTANEQKYTIADIDSTEIDENNVSDHACNQIAPNTKSAHAGTLSC